MQASLDKIRLLVRSGVRVLARALNQVTNGRVHPDAVTIFGFLMHIPIAVLIATSHFIIAAILLVIFGLFDTLDGELARLQHRESDRGGLLDASTDRMKEVLLYAGAAYFITNSARPHTAFWAVLACGASLSVSYVKAKGETVLATRKASSKYADLNRVFKDGLLTFELRMTVLVLGLLSGRLILAVIAIALLASFTALQRLVRISRALT